MTGRTTNKYTRKLLEGREGAPEELRGILFDAWMLSLVLDSLEPFQRGILEWLLLGEPKAAICTNDLCVLAHTTPTRAGVALSRLRKLGLIKTHYEIGDDNLRRAFHVAVPWVVAAERMRVQWDREDVEDVLILAGGEG